MLNVIMYLTPTLQEANRILKITYLLFEAQPEDGDPELYTGSFEQKKPIVRVGLYGNPDVECHFCVGTHNLIFSNKDSTWIRATALYHKTPWPFSLWIAWAVFIWNCLTGKRRMDPKRRNA